MSVLNAVFANKRSCIGQGVKASVDKHELKPKVMFCKVLINSFLYLIDHADVV